VDKKERVIKNAPVALHRKTGREKVRGVNLRGRRSAEARERARGIGDELENKGKDADEVF